MSRLISRAALALLLLGTSLPGGGVPTARAQAAPPAPPAASQASAADARGLLGVRVRKQDDGVRVLGIYAGSGAAEAGILPGDVLTSCDGNVLGPLERDTAFALLRGPVGSQAAVTLVRGGEVVELSVERRTNGARTNSPALLARSQMAAQVSVLRRALRADPQAAVASFLAGLDDLEEGQRALGCLRSAQAALQQQPTPEKIQAVMPLAREAARLADSDPELLLDLGRLFYVPAEAEAEAEATLRRSMQRAGALASEATDPLERARLESVRHQAAVALGGLLEAAGRHQEVLEALEPLVGSPAPSLLMTSPDGGLVAGLQTRRDRLRVLVGSARAETVPGEGVAGLAEQLRFGEDQDVRQRLREAAGREEADRLVAPPRPLAPLLGRSAPPLRGALAAGGEFDLDEARGHWTLVIFWATWCGPCKRELPYVQRWWDALGPKGLRVIAIATDREPGLVGPFLSDNRYTFPVLMGGQQEMGQWGVAGIPAGFLVDPDGRIHAGWRGFNTDHIEALGQRLEELVDGEGGEQGTYFARVSGPLEPRIRWLSSVPGIHALAESRTEEGGARLLAGRADGGLLVVDPRSGEREAAGLADVGPRPGSRLVVHGTAADELALSMKRRGSHLWAARTGQEESLLVHTTRNRIGGFAAGDLDGDGSLETAVAEPGAGDLVLRAPNGAILWHHDSIRGPLDVAISRSRLVVLTEDEILELDATGSIQERRPGPGPGFRQLRSWGNGLLLHDRGVSEVERLRSSTIGDLLMVRAGRRVSLLPLEGGSPELVLEVEAGDVDAACVDLDGDGSDELIVSSSEFGILALDLLREAP